MQVNGDDIIVCDRTRLNMAAPNLAIVETRRGEHIPPALWVCAVQVPEHLRALNAELEKMRLIAKAKHRR